jgi:hypothetical protein
MMLYLIFAFLMISTGGVLNLLDAYKQIQNIVELYNDRHEKFFEAQQNFAYNAGPCSPTSIDDHRAQKSRYLHMHVCELLGEIDSESSASFVAWVFYGLESQHKLLLENIKLKYDVESWHIVSWEKSDLSRERPPIRFEYQAKEYSQFLDTLIKYFDIWNDQAESNEAVWKSMSKYIHNSVTYDNPDVGVMTKKGVLPSLISTKKIILIMTWLFHNRYPKAAISKLATSVNESAHYLSELKFQVFPLSQGGAPLERHTKLRWARMSQEIDAKNEFPPNYRTQTFDYFFQVDSISVLEGE